jgi:hypothetical protein
VKCGSQADWLSSDSYRYHARFDQNRNVQLERNVPTTLRMNTCPCSEHWRWGGEYKDWMNLRFIVAAGIDLPKEWCFVYTKIRPQPVTHEDACANCAECRQFASTLHQGCISSGLSSYKLINSCQTWTTPVLLFTEKLSSVQKINPRASLRNIMTHKDSWTELTETMPSAPEKY